MDDRFDRTQREAEAAIHRAKERQGVARERRHALELRIAELGLSHPPHHTLNEHAYLLVARDRAAQAQASSARARERAEEARARRPRG